MPEAYAVYDPRLISYTHESDGYKHLIVSVIQLAISDAKSGDLEAADWLETDCPAWCELMDFDYHRIQPALEEIIWNSRNP